MRLIKLKASGFRSLKNIEVNFDSLTILIGENDAGKSSVLDFIEIFLDRKGKQPDRDDFRLQLDNTSVSETEIELSFELEDEDAEAQPYALNDLLRAKKIYYYDGDPTKSLYWTEKLVDPRLDVNFQKLNAGDQGDLLKTLDSHISTDHLKNSTTRTDWFDTYCAAAPKSEGWATAPRPLAHVLPRFERYSSLEYNAPENLIHKTLKIVYEQTIYEKGDGEISSRELIAPLQRLQRKAKERLEDKINELKQDIQRYNPRVHGVGYEPSFDFANSLRIGNFQVDLGLGPRILSKTGAGTKRCMFMAILEWDRRINIEQAQAGAHLPSIIRGYDEPDTNLHYEAQRLMYKAISDIAQAEDSRIQAVVCTHSITMIDRAPTQSIRLLRLNSEGATTVEQIITNDDAEIESFLNDLARELGITNFSLFYEKCFILVEGATEENALPVLYKRTYRSSLLEDGIQIQNLNGIGAAKQFLKLLSHNRQEVTIILIDEDAKTTKFRILTEEVLKDSGFDDSFIQERIIYIGDQEFEDAFPNEEICECLNLTWPKEHGLWEPDDIERHRSQAKFTKSLTQEVYRVGRPDIRSSWSKPSFGLAIARMCPLDKIPSRIVDLFELAREVAKIHETEEEIQRRRAFLSPTTT